MPQRYCFVVLNHLRSVKLRELQSSEQPSVCQRLLLVLVLTRTRSGCTTICLCRCFISVVLIRTLPDRLSGLIFATTSLFCLAKSASWLRFLSLNWIHSKIISGATFRIIGLTKIPKIGFLPLDWIYHSI